MEFPLIGRDGTDGGALARRLAVRERHLALFDELSRRGYFKYGCASRKSRPAQAQRAFRLPPAPGGARSAPTAPATAGRGARVARKAAC
jgi:hypothetical protein